MKLNRPFEEIVFFLGTRSYVQGTSLMEFFLVEVAKMNQLDDVKTIQLHRYKQISEVDCTICVKPEAEVTDQDDVRATCSMIIGGNSLSYSIVANGGELTRVPDMEYLQSIFEVNASGMGASAIIKPQAVDFIHLVHELVQLNKMFHLGKYTSDENKYKFVVGGFEKLTPMDMTGSQEIKIETTILREMNVGGMLLNMTKLTAIQGQEELSFLCPFVGKPGG